MIDILFSNSTIVTMDEAQPLIENGYLAVKSGKITYIGTEKPQEEAKRIIDGKRKVMMPGLINTHSHVPMTLLRGYADDKKLQEWLFDYVFPAEAKLDARCIRAGSALGIAEMLRSGTTSFTDMYYFLPDIGQVVLASGIKANLSNGVLDFSEKGFVLENTKEYKETMELLKHYHLADQGRIRGEASIHGEYTSHKSLWKKTSEFAIANDLQMHVHISETKKEQEDCILRHGVTPVTILNEYGVFDVKTTAAHCVHVTEKDMEIMASKGVSVAHNAVSNLKLSSGIVSIPNLIAHGVNVSLGTDSVCSNNNLDMFEEMKIASIVQKNFADDPTVLSAKEILKLATINGAKAQGREKECGMLKEGYDADLIMLDFHTPSLTPSYDYFSTLVYSAKGNDVIMTMVKGKILYENGEYKTIDIEKVYEEVETYVLPRIKLK